MLLSFHQGFCHTEVGLVSSGGKNDRCRLVCKHLGLGDWTNILAIGDWLGPSPVVFLGNLFAQF